MTSITISKDTRRRINLIPDLVQKVGDHDKDINELKKFVFIGNVDENTPSLAERMRNIEKTLENMLRLLWLVIAAVVTQIVLAYLGK